MATKKNKLDPASLKKSLNVLVDLANNPPLTVKRIMKDAYSNAVSKGFYENADKVSVGDRLALIHSEVSEALEEFRNNHPLTENRIVNSKPEGFPSEVADIVIRVCDMCEYYGIDLEAAIVEKMAYNATRSHRHGGKKI